MKKTWNLAATSIAAVTALVLADACADQASGALIGAGEALSDAGASLFGDGSVEMFRDAGGALVDAGMVIRDGGRDADAQESRGSQSGSRIEMRASVMTGADGSRIVGAATPYDTKRGEPCVPTVMDDGTTRCAPSSTVLYTSYFSDANCNEPLLLVTTPCAAPKYISVPLPTQTCATTGVRIYARGAGQSDYYVKAATCVRATLPAGWSAYKLGAEVPASSFVELEPAGHDVL